MYYSFRVKFVCVHVCVCACVCVCSVCVCACACVCSAGPEITFGNDLTNPAIWSDILNSTVQKLAKSVQTLAKNGRKMADV